MVDAALAGRCRRDVLATGVPLPTQPARAAGLPAAVPAGVVRAHARRHRELRARRAAFGRQVRAHVPAGARRAALLRR